VQYALSEVLAALPPALILVDSPAEAHDAEDIAVAPHWQPEADLLSHPAGEPPWKHEDEFDLSPMSHGEPHEHGDSHSPGEPLSLEASEQLDEPQLSHDAPQLSEPEHAGFAGHDLHDAGEPQEMAFPGHDVEPPQHDEFATIEFTNAPGPGSPFAEHGGEELPEMEFAPADQFTTPGEQEFSAPGEHDFSAPADDEFSEFPASGQHAFPPNEGGEFGAIEHEGFEPENALQPGDFTREVGEDTGEEIGVDEFSLPSPGAPPEAPVPVKGKKGAKAAKPVKVKAPKSDKPKRSFAGTLMLMLVVVFGGMFLVAGGYMGTLWFANKDVLEVAGIKLAEKLPSWAVPKAFQKGASRSPMLAGGPGMPPVNPLNQPAADLSEPVNPAPGSPAFGNPAAMPAEESAASAVPGNDAPPTPDSLDSPAPALTEKKPARKPAGDAEEMPAEKPGDAAADEELLTGLKPKPKAADDGFGAEPEEKMPAKKKPVENDELAGDEKKPAGDLPGADEKMSDEPLGEKAAGNKRAGNKVAANKVPEDDLLPGETPAGKPAVGNKPEMKDDLGLEDLVGKKPKAPADEPPKDEPLGEPVAPVAPPVTPLDAPAYTLADLDQAMTDVLDSTATMAEADTLAPDELKKARAQYYRRFYRLGEVLTFAEDDAAAPRLGDEKVAVIALLKKTGNDEEKLAQIGRAATKWLAFSKRGEHAGILVGGTVAEIVHEGKLYELKIAIPGVDEPVSVFSGAKPKVAEEDRVILLGSVVDDPSANLPGYEGTQSVVVWNGLTVKLPAEVAAEESK
jgi:hypothetical protein